MKTKSTYPKPRKSFVKDVTHKGFALISTVLIMSLLLMVSIAMLSFSSIVTSSSKLSKHQQAAQANARLAMMIAIGKLQQYAGQDQRVTFTASVFDDTPEDEEITGIKHPHWVGVARTDGFRADAHGVGLIQDIDNGLVDRRSNLKNDDKPVYDREKEVLSWLVSGENVDHNTKLTDNDGNALEGVAELLFSTGQTNDDGDRIGDVFAPLVKIKGDDGDGSYAYWVSDQSLKAKVSTVDPTKDFAIDIKDPKSLYWLIASQQHDLEQTLPKIGELPEEDIEKLYTSNQLGIQRQNQSIVGASLAEIKALGHDITPYGKSLFTDPVEGGLKKNLTAFLNLKNGVIDPETGREEVQRIEPLGTMGGIEDNAPIITKTAREAIGPKFGSLRSWYQLREEAGKLGAREISSVMPNTLPTKAESNAGIQPHPITKEINHAGVDPANFTKQPIHPVVRSAYAYRRFTYNSEDLQCLELIYPHVVMWNPYNVKLVSKEMFVEIDYKCENGHWFFSLPTADTLNESTKLDVGADFSQWHHRRNAAHKLVFYIGEVTFEPGQALTFTAPAGAGFGMKGTQFTIEEAKENPLSCEVDPGDLNCYVRTLFTTKDHTSSGEGELVEKYLNKSRFDRKKYQQFVYKGYVHSTQRECLPSQTVNIYGSRSPDADREVKFADLGKHDFPKIQRIELDHFGAFNNIWSAPLAQRGVHKRLKVGPVFHPKMETMTEVFDLDLPPEPHASMGFRFKLFYESQDNRTRSLKFKKQEPWTYAPIIHSNVRAGRAHRWPSDNTFELRYWDEENKQALSTGLTTYGPFAKDREVVEWNKEIMQTDVMNGKHNASVFQNRVESSAGKPARVVMFDLPTKGLPVTSLASFQHVQLTPYIWDPTYIIGSGYANPNPTGLSEGFDTSPNSTGQPSPGAATVSYLINRSAPTPVVDDLMWGHILQFNANDYQQHANDDVHLRSMSGYDNPLVYDIAYETNYSLWDKYFLTGLEGAESARSHLPNPRIKINSNHTEADPTDFHYAAKALINEGALNTHSTSVVAWKAILRGFNGRGGKGHPYRNAGDVLFDVDTKSHSFSRLLVPEVAGSKSFANMENENGFWNSYRKLSDDEIDSLAKEIVVQVKKRAPFIGVGDFVNRRLGELSNTHYDPEVILFGTIQAAINETFVIDKSGNKVFVNDDLDLDEENANEYTLPTAEDAKELAYGSFNERGEAFPAKPKPAIPMVHDTYKYENSGGKKVISEGAAAPGYLTQADVLQKIGSNLTVRGDTFVIRTYGESRDSNGTVKAQAWAEAVVQRTVDPITPDKDQAFLNPLIDSEPDASLAKFNFGRKFIIESFRWLNASEVQ